MVASATACRELTEATLAANEVVEPPTSPLPTIIQSTSSQPATLPTNPPVEAANPTQAEDSEDDELDPGVLAWRIPDDEEVQQIIKARVAGGRRLPAPLRKTPS